MQLVRTKKQKKKLLDGFENHQFDFSKFWFFISFSIANIIAVNLIMIRKLKVTFLINDCSSEFITSDQPIINLEKLEDETGNAKFFKLYLPISPNKAIIFDFDSDKDDFEEIVISEDSYVQ